MMLLGYIWYEEMIELYCDSLDPNKLGNLSHSLCLSLSIYIYSRFIVCFPILKCGYDYI